MSNNGKWTFSSNEEIFNYGEEYDTKEQAIEGGKDYFDDDPFYVGQIESIGLGVSVDVDHIFEHINQEMCSEVGEVADDYLMHVKKDHRQELESELTDIIAKWMERHGYGPTFFSVVNIEAVE